MAGERYSTGSQTLAYPVVGGYAGQFEDIQDTTVRPYTLNDNNVLALRLTAVEKKLQIEATLDDIYVDVGMDVVDTGKKIAIPDAVIMKLRSETKGEHKKVIPLISPLTGAARKGTEAQVGYERNMVLRYMEAYYNEYSQAIATETWGVNANQLDLVGYYEQVQPMLSKWLKENLGRQYREASLEMYSAETADPNTNEAVQGLNPNFFIANIAPDSQPAWNADPSLYRTNIVTACQAADTGTNGSNANIDLNYLIALEEWFSNTKRANPLSGSFKYVVTLPSIQYRKLAQTGVLSGSMWKDITKLTPEELNYSGVVGKIGSLLVIEDQRYPTISFTASYGNNTISPEYVEPGNDDGRNKNIYNATSNPSWDVGFIYGAGGLIDWEVTAPHFEKDVQDYGKKVGHGVFAERGIQTAVYRTDTSGTANYHVNVAALLFTATSLMNVA